MGKWRPEPSPDSHNTHSFAFIRRVKSIPTKEGTNLVLYPYQRPEVGTVIPTTQATLKGDVSEAKHSCPTVGNSVRGPRDKEAPGKAGRKARQGRVVVQCMAVYCSIFDSGTQEKVGRRWAELHVPLVWAPAPNKPVLSYPFSSLEQTEKDGPVPRKIASYTPEPPVSNPLIIGGFQRCWKKGLLKGRH